MFAVPLTSLQVSGQTDGAMNSGGRSRRNKEGTDRRGCKGGQLHVKWCLSDFSRLTTAVCPVFLLKPFNQTLFVRNLSPNPVHVLQGQGTQILGSAVGGFGVRLAFWASRAWSVSGWSQWDLCARRWGGWGSVCTQPCPWGLSVAVPCL